MIKKTLNTNFLILGIFLIIWATNAYFLFGSIGKYSALVLGFLFLIFPILKYEQTEKELDFFIKSIIFYLIFILIANIQNHYIDLLGIIFSLICLMLFNAGYIISTKRFSAVKVTNQLSLFFSSIVLIGSFFFLKKQTILYQIEDSVRDMGDDVINPNGVAYTHSLLFLFLFWLLYQNKNKIIRLTVLLAMFSVAMIIFTTEARGALISLSIVLLLFILKGNTFSKQKKKNYLKTFLVLGIISVLYSYFLKNIPQIEAKVNAILIRFTSLFEVIEKNKIDLSVAERQDVYRDFGENWFSYMFGQKNYFIYPHNQYLEIFMRWGMFGIPLLYVSIKYFIKSFKLTNQNKLLRQPILFLVIILFLFSYLQSMTSLSLEMNRTFWLGLGFLMGMNKSKIIFIKNNSFIDLKKRK